MQYTEEHYAEMYNNLPEGLKDLVLSGRLAILVSAIGSRHGLSADQISDLEPAVEDVCLGLITKDELVQNIQKNVESVDLRVANRIAAEVELEVLRPFDAELIISRKQKEELDEKIGKVKTENKSISNMLDNTVTEKKPQVENEPKNISDHAQVKKVTDWYTNDTSKNQGTETEDTKGINKVKSFDWDKDFAKQEAQTNEAAPIVNSNIEVKLDKLTESINQLVNVRFGGTEKKDEGISTQMQELMKRLERAEQENAENKKLIKSLQGTKPVESIFGNINTGTAPKQDPQKLNNKIQIDKQRKVEINHTQPEKETESNSNIQITSISKSVPITKQEAPKTDISNNLVNSTVSRDTVDSIVEIKNKQTVQNPQPEPKKSLTLEELISGADQKIKSGTSPAPVAKTATLVFPGLGETEKQLDIKNEDQKSSIKQFLMEDLAFVKTKLQTTDTASQSSEVRTEAQEKQPPTNLDNKIDLAKPTTTYDTNPFKEELLPTTKEDRMKALQDKIKSLNKGVSVGGKTNIAASGLDPYRL